MTETVRPPIVRRRFLQWSLAIFAVTIPMLVHSIWDYIESRKLTAAVKSIRTKNELTSLSYYPRLTGEAAEGERLYRAAAILASGYSEFSGLFARIMAAERDDAWPDELVAEVRTLLARKSDALRLADRAVQMKFAGFESSASMPWVRGGLASLQGLFGVRAVALALDGDAEGAAASLDAQIKTPPPFDGWYFRSSIMDDMRCVIERVRPSSPSLARVAVSLGELDHDNALKENLMNDRARILDQFRPAIGGRRLEERIGRPFSLYWLNEELDNFDELISASEHPWPERIDRFIAVGRAPFHPPFFAAVFAPGSRRRFDDRGALENRVWSTAEELGRLRSARVAIAIERYRREHAEQLPTSLEELVPNYLNSVPIDPFAGRPLIFSARSDGYAVYSVGHNRKDDGGNTRRLQISSEAWRKPDFPGDAGVQIKYKYAPGRSG